MKQFFVLLFTLFSSFTLATGITSRGTLWTRIQTPGDVQTSQIDAGYPMGCTITSILYALKFGPPSWKEGYKSIPGENDTQKIHSIASKFKKLSSRDSSDEAAFTEKYGTNPNDLPWMIQSLVPKKMKIANESFMRLARDKNPTDRKLIEALRSGISNNLNNTKPVIAQLYFSNPEFSHSILITGIEESNVATNIVVIMLLDPATGKESSGTLTLESNSFVSNKVVGFSFYAPTVIEKKGILTHILL